MAADLAEIKGRISWAKDRSIVLGAEIEQFLKTSAYTLESTHSEETGYTELFIVKKMDPPVAIRASAGSILHELRACLDALACQLAVRNGRTTKDTYFPISADRTVFKGDGHKKMRKLSDSDRAAIEALQPYGGGNDMLLALHRADLVRKHQRLILTGGHVGADMRGATLDDFAMNTHGVVNDRFPVARWRGRNTFNLRVGVDLCFSEPQLICGRPISTTLDDFASLVQSVIEIFD